MVGDKVNNITSFDVLVKAIENDMALIQRNIINNVSFFNDLINGVNIATPNETRNYLGLN